jgi:hypothetical protein
MKKILLLFAATISSLSASIAQTDSSAFYVIPVGFATAQYITSPITPTLQFTSEFTLECWVFIVNSNSQEIHLIESYSGNSGGYVLRIGQNGAILAYAMGASQPSLSGLSNVFTNQWNHLAATYSTATGELKVFLNGVQDGASTPGNAIYNNAAVLKIGARGDDSDINSPIYMDEVRMWNVARTEAQIAASMNECLVGNEAGLVLYYDFENDVATTVTDKTTNGNNGTIVSNGTPYVDGAFSCQPSSASTIDLTSNELTLFPNPTTGLVSIQFEGTASHLIQEIRVINAVGECVQTETSFSFSIAHLPAGIYLLNVQTTEGMSIQRIIKQ